MSVATADRPVIVRVRPKKKGWYARWLATFGLNSFMVSVLVHIFFGVIAVYLVVEHIQKKHVTFNPTPPPNPQVEVELKNKVIKRDNAASAPPDFKVITTTELSPIVMPDIPVPPPTDEVSPSPMSGVGLEGFTGHGTGPGDKGGEPYKPYGVPIDGNGLVGNLYDLKQTPDGQPTDIAETATEKSIGPDTTDPSYPNNPPTQAQLSFLGHFVTSWDASLLNSSYYKSDVSLSLSQVCIPDVHSSEATVAFHVQDKVVARRWIAVYQAKIVPPETGNYRFIGFGDDFLVVNVDGRNVLDGSYDGEMLDRSANGSDRGGPSWVGDKPLRCGQWVQMQAGLAVDFKLLIGEGPGGSSGFVVLVQKQGDNSPSVFQIGDNPIPVTSMNMPMPQKTMQFSIGQ
jgi:hypothetical protein